MKKTLLLVGLSFFLVACSQEPTGNITKNNAEKTTINLNLPKQWTVKEDVDNKIVINIGTSSSTDSEEPVPTDITLFYYQKSPENSITKWVKQHESQFEESSFEGRCNSLVSTVTATVYNCGELSAEYYLLNKEGDKVVRLFLGKNPVISADDFFRLVSFQ